MLRKTIIKIKTEKLSIYFKSFQKQANQNLKKRNYAKSVTKFFRDFIIIAGRVNTEIQVPQKLCNFHGRKFSSNPILYDRHRHALPGSIIDGE